MRARGYVIAVIMALIFLFTAQNTLGDRQSVLMSSDSLDEYQSLIDGAYFFGILGIIIGVGGVVGLVQYFRKS